MADRGDGIHLTSRTSSPLSAVLPFPGVLSPSAKRKDSWDDGVPMTSRKSSRLYAAFPSRLGSKRGGVGLKEKGDWGQ